MAEQQNEEVGGCAACCCCPAIIATVAGLVYLLVLLVISKDATHSVTVTGVAGLDPSADLASTRPKLSPVLNLTVRIDNARDRFYAACVTGFSTVLVSYWDAFLARGSVPPFCAGSGKVRERGPRAWGDGVDVPRFLRDQLAGELAVGEAAVDVEVTMPKDDCYSHGCLDMVLVCSGARIGGGPGPPCRRYYRHQAEQAPGSTN